MWITGSGGQANQLMDRGGLRFRVMAIAALRLAPLARCRHGVWEPW